jgi:FMN hydrolase / 5-amino-6-(5-phospho-D-ribitylamino)uracil phosphatase
MSSGSEPQVFGGVSAVTFDGDGTIWDFESAMLLALEGSARFLNEAGLRHAGGPVEAGWLADVRDRVAADPELRGRGMEAIRLAAFEQAVRLCDPERIGIARTVHERYMEARFTELRAYPEASAALTALRGRFRLALVTNGNTHPHRLGLEELFTEVVIAFECGVEKPDPGIYRLAMERLGVRPDACLHVGDDPDEDVEAARRAGMRSVWVNRDGRSWPDRLRAPDAEVRDLTALTRLL